MTDQYVGKSTSTLDSAAFVSGRSIFTADHSFPGQLHAHFVRSTHASAKIVDVDLSGAEKVAGVVLAMDGAEAVKHLDPIPHFVDPILFGGKTTDLRCLALSQVQYFGEPVAVVVAEDKKTALYAASRINVTYEPLEAVLDASEAVKSTAPRVVSDWEDNFLMQVPFGGGA